MRVVVPLATAVFVLAAVVLPLARLWLRAGTFGLVFAPRGASLAHVVNGGLFAVSVAGFSVLVVAVAERSSAVGPVGVAGLVVAGVGLAVVVAAQAQMGASWRIGIDDRPTELVERGLYAWSRNPIYLGVLVWLVGMLLVAPSAAGLALAGLAVVSIAVQVRLEEAHLLALHGDRFRAYAARVARYLTLRPRR